MRPQTPKFNRAELWSVTLVSHPKNLFSSARVLPTETKFESGTPETKGRTSDNLSNSVNSKTDQIRTNTRAASPRPFPSSLTPRFEPITIKSPNKHQGRSPPTAPRRRPHPHATPNPKTLTEWSVSSEGRKGPWGTLIMALHMIWFSPLVSHPKQSKLQDQSNDND